MITEDVIKEKMAILMQIANFQKEMLSLSSKIESLMLRLKVLDENG